MRDMTKSLGCSARSFNGIACAGLAVYLVGFAACISLAACASAKPGTLAEDPAGRFYYEIAAGVIEEATDGSYSKYRLTQPEMKGYIVAVDAPSEAEGLSEAFRKIGMAFGDLKLNGISSYKEWRLLSYAVQGDGQWMAAATQYRGGTLYAFIVAGGEDTSPDSLPQPFMVMLTSFRFTEKAGEVFAPKSLPELEGYIDAAIASTGGAVSVAAILDGKIVYRYASGLLAPDVPAHSDAAFHWGSITKLVTGTAIMREVERGTINLDSSVDLYLQLPASVGRITVRDLLSHTSGLPEGPESVNSTALVYYKKDAMPPLEEIWSRYIKDAGKALFEPGTQAAYNNFNYLALGVILERVTGQRLTDYAKAQVLKPLGMTKTAYFSEDLAGQVAEALLVPNRFLVDTVITTLERVGYPREDTVAFETDGIVYFHPIDIFSAWGGVKGTAEDAARLGWMFLNDGAAESGRILTPKTIAAMQKARTATDGSPLPFGLTFKIFATGKQACFGHDGGGPGIESTLRIYPRHKLVIAVLGSANSYGADTVVEYLKDILSSKDK